jgi:hypothetical protein
MSTLTKVKLDALDTFIRTGKSEGWWSSLKRLYLPIWASAAPNAVDMITRASGTFNGTVTHAAGYVQGNGSTGYFDPGAGGNSQTLGMGGDNLHYMLGLSLGGTTQSVPIGAWDGNPDKRSLINNKLSPTSTNGFANPANAITSAAENNDVDRTGILVGASTSFSARYLHRRKTSGTTVVSNGVNENRTIPNTQPFIMARNDNGSPNTYYNGRIFAAGYGLAIAQADAGDFSLAIKNLYEATTGLTLP